MSNEEMKSKLDGFKKTYSDFMMGNIDDEELAKKLAEFADFKLLIKK